MRTRLLPFSFLVPIGLAVLSPAVARADLPRPEGWEPSCTIAKMQSPGSSCEQCRGFKDPDPCQEELAKKGYVRQCQEGGAGSYVAVWCKAGAASNSPDLNKDSTGLTPIRSASPAPAPAPAPLPPSSDNRRGTGGCGMGGDASELQGLSALLAVGLGLALLSRRRR